MPMHLLQWFSDFSESFCCGGGLQTCWQTSFSVHECQVFVDQGVLVLFLPVFPCTRQGTNISHLENRKIMIFELLPRDLLITQMEVT